MKTILLLALATISVPSVAQEAPQELWGGVKLGMPGMEARALYPKLNTRLTPECKTEISFKMDDAKRVQGVRLFDGSMTCGELVMNGLRAKYGEPVSTRTEKVGPVLKQDTIDHYRFEGDTVAVDLRMDRFSWGGGYEAVYTSRSASENLASKL
jgi:hypothetical protein